MNHVVTSLPGLDAMTDRVRIFRMRKMAILLALVVSPWTVVSSESPDKLYGQASAFIRRAQYDGAIAALDTALVIEPRFARGYWLRAFAHRHGGRPQRSLADYTRAIELQPSFAWAFANRGSLRQELGDVDGAIEDFNEAIRLNGWERDYYNSRGVAFRLKGRLDEALSDYDKAVELDPFYATAYANRAIAWENKGDFERALEEVTRALSVNPRHANALNTRAWIRSTSADDSLRDGQSAIEDARLACDLSRWATPNFIATLAAARRKLGISARRSNFRSDIWRRRK